MTTATPTYTVEELNAALADDKWDTCTARRRWPWHRMFRRGSQQLCGRRAVVVVVIHCPKDGDLRIPLCRMCLRWSRFAAITCGHCGAVAQWTGRQS